MNFKDLTIITALKGLEQKDFSHEELVSASEEKICELEPSLRAFITVGRIEPEAQGVLSGIPCAVKDVIVTKGVKTTAGSKILENYLPEYDATAVAKLKKEGAVIMGKTNCDEFAMGSSTEHSAFFPTRNPHDPERVPGGSSGGSAAAVASGEVLFALGTDTGGSVRQPAAFCGCAGYKPTYGRVSRYGLIAMASSLDQVGIFAKTCEDTLIILKVIEGKDPLDATSKDFKKQSTPTPWGRGSDPDADSGSGRRRRSVGAVNSQHNLKGVKFGVVKEYMESAGLDSEVREAIRGATEKIEEEGGELVEVSLPHAKYALPCYYLVMPSEVSSNLARFDGIRYGVKQKGDDLLAVYVNSRTAGFGDEVKRRVMLGTFALSAGYYDQYYKQALKMRAKIREDYEKVFRQVDFLLTPTAPSVAFKFGEKIVDPLQMYLEDVFTVSLNLAGLPGVSIPCGWKAVEGKKLPIGMQLIASWGKDQEMLEVGSVIEKTISHS